MDISSLSSLIVWYLHCQYLLCIHSLSVFAVFRPGPSQTAVTATNKSLGNSKDGNGDDTHFDEDDDENCKDNFCCENDWFGVRLGFDVFLHQAIFVWWAGVEGGERGSAVIVGELTGLYPLHYDLPTHWKVLAWAGTGRGDGGVGLVGGGSYIWKAWFSVKYWAENHKVYVVL